MASMRVHELAKEFGMDSKDLLSRIQDMKIPAKSHASVLSDANVDKIRKTLAPELGEKVAAEIDAEAAAAARAEAEAERKRKEDAERERREAVERERALREAERARRETSRPAAGSQDAKEAETPARRVAPSTVSSGLSSLAQQIEEQKAAEAAAKAKRAADARAAKLAAEVAKRKAVAENLARGGRSSCCAQRQEILERRQACSPQARTRPSSQIVFQLPSVPDRS